MKSEELDKISVIIPVWNAGKYLREALDTLRGQSYTNFEAILVNDGSTDDSESICREFCNKDSRFKLINQTNSGVSAARNAGIEASKGDWVSFVDSDDILMAGALETLMEAAIDSGCGIVVGGYVREQDETEAKRIAFKYHKKRRIEILNNYDAIKTGLYQKKILNSPWGVLYRKSVFEDNPPLRFRKCRYEDLDLFYQVFERVKQICVLDDIVYFYRDNPGSFINTWSDSRLDVLDVTDRMVEHFRSKEPTLLRAAEDRRFSAHYNMLLAMRKYGVRNREQKARCKLIIKSRRWAEITDSNVRIKNKLGALLSYLLVW